MTFIGIWAPRSATKSMRPVPTSGSSDWAQNSRICGSSAAILRGVNIRASSLRWMSWIGGSSMMSRPGGMSRLALISSRMMPRAELNVPWSTRPLSTSAEPAQGVEIVLRVVVQRRFFAEPAEHRIGVGVEDDVVRVVVDVTTSWRSLGSEPVLIVTKSCLSLQLSRPDAPHAGVMPPVCQRLRRFGRFVPFA